MVLTLRIFSLGEKKKVLNKEKHLQD